MTTPPTTEPNEPDSIRAKAVLRRNDIAVFLAVVAFFLVAANLQYHVILGLEATPRTLFLPVIIASAIAGVVTLLRRSRAELQNERDALRSARARIAELNRRLEDKVRAQSEQLDEYEDKLAAAQRRGNLGLVAAGVIHDINNAVMITYSSLELLKLEDTPESREDLQAARSGIAQVKDLAVSFRDIVHPVDRSGTTHALATIQRLLPSLKRTFHRTTMLQFELPDATSEVCLPMTETAFGQIILNLMINAKDAVGQQSGTVVMRLQILDDQQVELAVSDSGPGIPQDIRAQIFVPFFSTKSADKGSGLGLHVLHRIVTEAGGTVEVDQSKLGGARFVVRLPCVPPDDSRG